MTREDRIKHWQRFTTNKVTSEEQVIQSTILMGTRSRQSNSDLCQPKSDRYLQRSNMTPTPIELLF